MLLVLRRYLALAALFFWQGGFTFYASVVVPVGQDEFSHLEQGLFITRQVTVWLNLSGSVALVLLAWEVLAARDPSRPRRWLRWLLWLGMAAALVALYRLHPLLDQFLDPVYRDISDRKAFRPYHRLYLWVSTVQWGCAIVYLLLTLLAWRAEDRRGVSAEPDQGHGLSIRSS
ncbi:MAG TPA: hypothetical protein VFE78_37605 [Gemmataceae bacterium]|jgi:hypothetical protein|nr:hypothetical protein [Gemmataceae bacterium]